MNLGVFRGPCHPLKTIADQTRECIYLLDMDSASPDSSGFLLYSFEQKYANLHSKVQLCDLGMAPSQGSQHQELPRETPID